MEPKAAQRLAMRVSWVSIVWNLLLSAFKLFAGVFARSGAMISDAVHSSWRSRLSRRTGRPN